MTYIYMTYIVPLYQIEIKVIEKIPLTVEAIQYNSEKIDVNNKGTLASTIAFRTTHVRTISRDKWEQGRCV